MYYGWSKEFPEVGKNRLAGDMTRAATSDDARDPCREAQAILIYAKSLSVFSRRLLSARPPTIAQSPVASAGVARREAGYPGHEASRLNRT